MRTPKVWLAHMELIVTVGALLLAVVAFALVRLSGS